LVIEKHIYIFKAKSKLSFCVTDAMQNSEGAIESPIASSCSQSEESREEDKEAE
jgi:hypothetical protein